LAIFWILIIVTPRGMGHEVKRDIDI